MTTIDVQSLSDEQLAALMLIDSVAAKAEQTRRQAYLSLNQGFRELAQAGVHLEAILDSYRLTPVTKAIQESRVVEVVRRLVITARKEGHEFPEPTPVPVIKPKRATPNPEGSNADVRSEA